MGIQIQEEDYFELLVFHRDSMKREAELLDALRSLILKMNGRTTVISKQINILLPAIKQVSDAVDTRQVMKFAR